MEQIEALTEILPYVRKFQGKTFVIKLGGELCEAPHLSNIAQQISLIQHIGIKVVLVHGGGPQLQRVLDMWGHHSEKVGGRRITDGKTLEAAEMVFAGRLGSEVVSALIGEGANAIGLSGVDGSLIKAKRRAPQELEVAVGRRELVDFQYVGDVLSVNNSLLELLITQGYVPVLSSLAIDEKGQVLNVNADSIASKVAQSVKAEKLIVMSNVPGVLQNVEDRSTVLSYGSVEDIELLIKKGHINGGMLPKVRACIEAVAGGVARSHIIDGTRRAALLLELFMNEGVGTMIS